MRSSFFALLLCVTSVAILGACSETNLRTPADAGTPDPGTVDADDAGDDGVDAAAKPDVDAGEAGGGDLEPTKKTVLDSTINGVSRTLHRAQFGVTKEGASETLWIEAHEGGVEACPETATPARTMRVSGVPKGAPGEQFDKTDGIAVALFDFTGDQIAEGNPTTTASAAKVTIVALEDGVSTEIEVEATFPEGTAKGRIYATYCESLSQ